MELLEESEFEEGSDVELDGSETVGRAELDGSSDDSLKEGTSDKEEREGSLEDGVSVQEARSKGKRRKKIRRFIATP
ncbi:MAG: hypothetical protein ACI32C_04420 [Candidatus Enteromonas sp.]